MSDTLAALDEAIQKHIAANFPGSITDAWILVTHSQTIEKHQVSNYRIVTPASQPIHVDAGMKWAAKMILRDSWDGAFNDGDDDDE